MSPRPPVRSAGLLLHRSGPAGPEVLIAHMGGPLWARRDERAWSIPKGEYAEDEEPLAAARREFAEELGSPAPDGEAVPLGEVRQSSGKRVSAWALAGDLDVSTVRSNTFEMEWPRGSGRLRSFPEIDRAGWFELDAARPKLVTAQVAFLDRLAEVLDGGAG
jgi:predicted NUDIX family NTP pyrophosphohydrolase